MYYFAYGSNMASERLAQRVPSALVVGVYPLPQHRLMFHKVSKDGSAKADAFFTGDDNDELLGVVFHIDPAEKPSLDKVEGLGYGYELKQLEVAGESGKALTVFLYVATQIDKALKPYDWYKKHVLIGAQEAGLPDTYIANIAAVEAIVDADNQRAAREFSIHKK